MAVDTLQEKIRKMKNPTMLELCMDLKEIPPALLQEQSDVTQAFEEYAKALLRRLKEVVPAVRFNFLSFAVQSGGIALLIRLLSFAKKEGYYVLLDAPEILSPRSAELAAEGFFCDKSEYDCDGLIISGYIGSDAIKPFLPYCRDGKKDIFVVARTANKSAPEIQDLLAGGRLVHAAAADHVNRYGAETKGKFAYTRVGILAAASSAESLKNLRKKYPSLFLIIDGADYPNANAKNCANAFDKFGHGAVAVVGSSVTGAWKQSESGEDWLEQAEAAALRMKKNLNRYVTIM